MGTEIVVDMPAVGILVVDDDELFLDALSRMLSRNEYQVHQTASPLQALEIVKDGHVIDLVVSDIELPEMRGTQLVREIMQLSPQTACLLITGSVTKLEDAPDGVGVLRKPFSIQDLLAAVQNALARSTDTNSA